MKNGKLVAGQIGCGAFAEGMDFPNFTANPKVEMKWRCDISYERAKEMADKFGVPNVTTDFTDIINDDEVDLIKIATSHEVHLPIIRAAAAKGKHIFCEKPMALDIEEGYKIIEIIRKTGIKFCVDLNRRMSPAMHAMKKRWREHIAKPQYNPWRFIETERELLPEEHTSQFLIRIQDESASYRVVHLNPLKGGGEIIGETVHWLDLACWLYSDQFPSEITAWGSSRLSHGINIKFSKGDNATIVFNCGGTFDYPKELYEITSHGALFRSKFFVENNYYGIPGRDKEYFPLLRDPLPDIGQEGGFSGYMKKYYERVKNLSNSKVGHNELAVDKGHKNMLDTFINAILENKPSPCNEISGFISTYLAKLAIQSIKLHKTLPVPVEDITPCIGI